MVKQCVPPQHNGAELGPVFPDQGPLPSIKAFRDLMERRYLEQLLTITRGGRKEACRISGLSRTRLFELLKKYDLANPKKENHKYLRSDSGREAVGSSLNCCPAHGGP
jgi:DNA-binding NtrC family response regulator